MPLPTMTPEAFWQSLDKNGPLPEHHPELGPCWLWTGNKSPSGYGVLRRFNKDIRAHRFAYQLSQGEIPFGLRVHHHCDRRNCCAPTHLWLGTHKQNMGDMTDKGRQSHGDKHYAHKVTAEQVKEMRRLYSETKIPLPQIAKQFGLSKFAAGKAIRGETWKCLGPMTLIPKRGTKMSPETVQEIRRLRTSGTTARALAVQFHLSFSSVTDIVSRRTWKDLK